MTFEIPGQARTHAPVVVERRHPDQPPDRQSGIVVSIGGSRALVSSVIPRGMRADEPFWAVGNLITIYSAKSRVICLVQTMGVVDNVWTHDADNVMHVTVELLG